MTEDNLAIVAAGVAFNAFLAVVPALAAVLGLYALLADPGRVSEHIESLRQIVPDEVMPLLQRQITRITQDQQAAGISAVLGILIALYGSARATKGIIIGLNIVHDEREKRGFFRLNATALVLTLGMIVGVVAVLGLMTVLPPVMRALGVGTEVETLVSVARWPVLVALFIFGLGVLYRFGPSHDSPRWKWLSPGAVLGAVLWIAGSAGLSWYVSSFGNYQEAYGSLGAIVVFLLWLMLSAFAVLLGAELDSELELQTASNTSDARNATIGAWNPG